LRFPCWRDVGGLTLSESLSCVYTRHAVSDKGSCRCGSPTAAARNRCPRDALDVPARAACPRIGAPESLPPTAGACHPALPPPHPLHEPFCRRSPTKRTSDLASARSEGLRGQREERDMFPQPRPMGCDHCPLSSSPGWSWPGVKTRTMAAKSRCEWFRRWAPIRRYSRSRHNRR
jgi:hypothetical protein